MHRAYLPKVRSSPRTVQLVLVRLTAILAFLSFVLAAHAAPRLGAPRALRIVDLTGHPLDGDLQEPAVAADGTLYFTRQWAGTGNLWRATPDSADRSRFPVWKAAPVTRFEPPRFASRPLPLPDGRGLVFVTNVTNPAGAGATVTQIARLDLRSGSLAPITSGSYRQEEPAVAPDGSALAYTSDRAGFQAVYIQSLEAPAESARRVALRARRPAFLPDGSLLFENLRPLSTGLYRLAAPGNLLAVPDLFTSLAGEAASAADSSLMLLSGAANDSTSGKRLYALAVDGSGLRAVPGTNGARRPAFAPDNQTAFFDAPSSEAPGAPRAIWLIPLLRDAPVAKLLEVRPASGGALTIVGTLAGEGATATLEVGAGENPRRWTQIPVALPPVTEAPIALWAPGGARGLFTLRLVVTDGSGETMQSLMAVNLPLGAPARSTEGDPPPVRPTNPPPFLPDTTIPRNVPPRPIIPVIPRPTPEPTVPPLPPLTNATPPPYPQVPLPVLPANPPGGRPGAGSLPPSMPLPNFPTGTKPVPTPAPTPAPTPTPRPVPRRTPAPPPATGGDAGELNVSGTLATMTAGQSSTVTVWVKNTGSRDWPAGQAGQLSGAIRFVARWVDFETGQRRKWAYNWLRGDLPPGGTSRWNVELKAPSRPGRYKLIYGLIRLPEGDFQPPPYNASQDRWPGEFTAIAFAVNVK